MLQIGRAADFPMASALSMILMLVVTAAYLLFARYLRMEESRRCVVGQGGVTHPHLSLTARERGH
jgi:ABC-type Fe3+ transport system permease subunit